MLVACLPLALVACSSPPHLEGYLYAASGSHITVTSLDTGNVIAAINAPDGMDFRYATKIDNRTMWISGSSNDSCVNGQSGQVNQRTSAVMRGSFCDWLYDRFTGELIPYALKPQEFSGINMPVYMPKYKTLVFYCGINRLHLCRVSLGKPGNVEVVDPADNRGEEVGGYGYYPIVAVSNDEVVYANDDDDAKYYDLNTGIVGSLQFADKCVPQLWLATTMQLMCAVFQPKTHFYLVSLRGTGKQYAPNFNGTPAIYLPRYDTVIAGGLRLLWSFPDPVPHEWSTLRSYDLTSGRVHVFGSGSWGGQGGVAWFPDIPKKIPGITLGLHWGTANPKH